MTSSLRGHSGAQLESPHWNKRHFYHPGNAKGFKSSVLGRREAEINIHNQCINIFLTMLQKIKRKERGLGLTSGELQVRYGGNNLQLHGNWEGCLPF